MPEESPPTEGVRGPLALGRSALRERRFGDAAAAFERALEDDPAHRGALTGLAWARRGLGDPAGALAAFRRALAGAPEHPDLLRHVVRESMALGRFEEALRLADRARALVPQEPWFAVARARLLEDLNPTLGRAAWAEAEELAPDDAGVAIGLARTAHREHEPERAAGVLRRVAGLRPGEPGLVLELARTELELGRGAAALEALDAIGLADAGARRGDRHLRRATDLRVRAHLLLGGTGEASVALEAAVADLDDRDAASAAWSATWRAEIAAATWDLRAADEHLERALSLELSIARAKRLAQVRLASLDPEGARDAWRIGTTLVQERRGGRASDVPWRVSAGLIGDLINEYLLEPALTAEARRVLLDDDVEAARSLVRRAPDAHAAATALLVVLRRAGTLDATIALRPTDAATGPIPKRLWQAWLGSSVPDDVQRLGSRWHEHHEGWEHTLLDDRAVRDFIDGRGVREEAEALSATRSATARADLLRLILLDDQGGFWVDADDLPLRTLDPLRDRASLVVPQEPFGAVGNHLIGAVAGHPVVRSALAEVIENLRAGARESPWLSSGPGPLTRALARAFAQGTPPPWRLSDGSSAASIGLRVLHERERMQVVSGFRRMSYKSSSRWWRNAAAADPVPIAREPNDRPRDLLCWVAAGLGDALREIGICLAYARTHGRRLVLQTEEVLLPIPFTDCFEVDSTVEGQVPVILDPEDWDVADDATVLPSAAAPFVRWSIDRARRPPDGPFGDGGALGRAPSVPASAVSFSINHEEDILVHHRHFARWSDRRIDEHPAIAALRRLRLRPWLAAEIRGRLAHVPIEYAGIHIRNTDIRSNHVPFLLSLRDELADRDVLVCSDDAGSIDDARLLLDRSRVFQVSHPPQTLARSLHADRHRDPRRSTVDLFADLFALAGATELRTCPTRRGDASFFADLAARLNERPELRRALLHGERP